MNIKDSISWYKNLDSDIEFLTEELKYTFAMDVEKMMEQRGISKSQLAKRIDSSPAYITKVLRGDANMTIETMSKLSHYVDGALHIHIAPIDADVRWFDVITNQVISKSTNRPATEDYSENFVAKIWAESTTSNKKNGEHIAI